VIAELKAQIEALHEEIRARDASTDEHSRRCASLQDCLTQLRLEMTGMQQELAGAVAAGSHASAQRDALEGELRTLVASHDELKQRLSASTAAITASEAAARVVELERDSIAARLGDAQQQLSDMNVQRAGAAAQADAVIAELKAQIEALHEEIRARDASTDEHSRRCTFLQYFLLEFQHDFFATQDMFASFMLDLLFVSGQIDALVDEIFGSIDFRLKERNKALQDCQAAARNYEEYCIFIEAKLGDVQRQLIDVNLQTARAAAQADAVIAELRAQIEALHEGNENGRHCACVSSLV
jgi:hypothetical protein